MLQQCSASLHQHTTSTRNTRQRKSTALRKGRSVVINYYIIATYHRHLPYLITSLRGNHHHHRPTLLTPAFPRCSASLASHLSPFLTTTLQQLQHRYAPKLFITKIHHNNS
ncbi:hypothetical protein E2C01_097933 [Portunus trituberculatus]|uniref:Uncharacterized protein n=1 Tax=Portunus trituberculatus TaxID=210409 RepID=A0A5B7KCN9_PORTR|nr:hypothetical protein [Portunus trituberculatus]